MKWETSKLPTKEGDYLITCIIENEDGKKETKVLAVEWWEPEKCFADAGVSKIYDNPIAWMKFPEPYMR